MNKAELAVALDISASMVSRLAKRGMPTDSVDKAIRWRNRHLEFARSKGNRAGTWVDVPADPVADAAVRQVEVLMQFAQPLAQAGLLATVETALRAAFRAVPAAHRRRVCIETEVMDFLCADVLAVFESEATGAAGERGPMSDDELEAMGDFWYQVAAGEVVAVHGGKG